MACATRPVPDWIELKGPTRTSQEGLAWDFTVRTDRPGQFRTSIVFECDTGQGHCEISLEIKDGVEPSRDLVLCDSPFDCCTTGESLQSLVRILDHLPLRVHCLGSFEGIDELNPKTILLHQSGLLRSQTKDTALLHSLVSRGVNLVVLADEFYCGTTEAANKVLAPFGLRLMQDGSDDPNVTQQERRRRIINWQQRYNQADSSPDEITLHPLTIGVKRVQWFRPCPVICAGDSAVPLIKNPADHEECFAAVSHSNGYVVAVGKSLWVGLSAVGWPYDNDRLFANLIFGGDAESTTT